MKRFLPKIVLSLLLVVVMLACRDSTSDDSDEPEVAETITPVTITHPSHNEMEETVEVNAISSYQLKTFVKATANGYVISSHVRLGDFVTKGQTVFVIKTKEAAALGNTIRNIDSSLNFTGMITMKAPGSGYITQLTFTSGNYVQDGEQLAEITDTRSFVFILDLPYELRQYIPLNQTLQLHLPDSTSLEGQIQSVLPVVDSVSQTERYIIKVKANTVIPENLIAKVRLIKKIKPNATTLPKEAILSNEEQTEFWIMQLINDSVAVKVPIEKGIEEPDKIEILSPQLPDSANILLTGNYGLEDTAKVNVLNRSPY